MMDPTLKARPAELPPPTAELVLIAALYQYEMLKMSKKERAAFGPELLKLIGWQDEYTKVVPIRPPEQWPAQVEARQQASAWISRLVVSCRGGMKP